MVISVLALWGEGGMGGKDYSHKNAHQIMAVSGLVSNIWGRGVVEGKDWGGAYSHENMHQIVVVSVLAPNMFGGGLFP